MADENFEFPEFFVYRHLGLVGCNISIHSVAILSFGETYSSLS